MKRSSDQKIGFGMLAWALSDEMHLRVRIAGLGARMPRPRVPASSFRYFNSSPEVIRLAVMLYVKHPLSLRNVEDLLHERGIDISYETVRYW